MLARFALSFSLFAAAAAVADEPPPSRVTAVWANDGGDKVVRGDCRATGKKKVTGSTWDGKRVTLAGAQNEVLGFVLVLEAGAEPASGVSVTFDRLVGPKGFEIRSLPAKTRDGVFDWTERRIELFLVRYLQIRGLSRHAWEPYDERHVPARMRRPFGKGGAGRGGWQDRPDHDAAYPDIAVPMELSPSFSIVSSESQSVWVDVYIPKTAPAGEYTGDLRVSEEGRVTRVVPVSLTVWPFALRDEPAAKSMIYLGYADINGRYLGVRYPTTAEEAQRSALVRDRHFQLAHRHKLALIDSNEGGGAWGMDAPRPEWRPRLDGSLFTPARGYDGPGVGRGNGVYSIGTYGSWGWKDGGEDAMRLHTDGWATWFAQNAPRTETFLYLVDESPDTEQIERWASWMRKNPGPGRAIPSLATMPMPAAVRCCLSLDIAMSTLKVALTEDWTRAAMLARSQSGRRLYVYNGGRPASGTNAIEDEGVALRMVPWAQHKLGIRRWFQWESTYYTNYQGGTGETNVLQRAQTFGGEAHKDPVYGETGWHYANGDGVLFYPGTDLRFPADSYGVAGPLASLRLKHWRRGVQDIDYVVLARKRDAKRTDAIVQRMVPKVLWEVGVDDPKDPTYKHGDVSWSSDPEAWEAARRELAAIIRGE